MTLWTKFTAWLSGWPESTAQGKKLKKDAEEEKREKPKKKKTSKKKAPKKSKSKGLKQGNMT